MQSQSKLRPVLWAAIVLGSTALAAPVASAILERRVVYEETWENGFSDWNVQGAPGIDCGRGRPGCSLSIVNGWEFGTPYLYRDFPDVPVPVDGKLRISTYLYIPTDTCGCGNVAEFAIRYNIGGVFTAYAGFGYTSDGIWYHGANVEGIWLLPSHHAASTNRWYLLVMVLDESTATIKWEVRDSGGSLLWSSLPNPITGGWGNIDSRVTAPLAGGPITVNLAYFVSYRYDTLWFDTLRFESEGETLPPIRDLPSPGDPEILPPQDVAVKLGQGFGGINCVRVTTGSVRADTTRLLNGDLLGWINPATPIVPYVSC